MLIIPDTNFLIYAAKFRLWHELDRQWPKHSLLVLPQVIYELTTVAKSTKTKGRDKEASVLALELLQGMKTRPKEGHADKAIFQRARMLMDAGEKNFVVATMDRELAQKLKKAGIKLLTIRQKKCLIVD